MEQVALRSAGVGGGKGGAPNGSLGGGVLLS